MPQSTQILEPSSAKVEPSAAQHLLNLIDTREATIGVVGLGYVGLPLAVEYADAGFDTVGIDMDGERVDRLEAGRILYSDRSALSIVAGGCARPRDRGSMQTKCERHAALAGRAHYPPAQAEGN